MLRSAETSWSLQSLQSPVGRDLGLWPRLWRPNISFDLHVFLGSRTVRVLSSPGRMVHLQCVYKFEDKEPLPQLSVQWKDPSSRLLCQHIKHKQFQWCSDGYDLSYRPANITLTIQRVQDLDFGVHVCSVNKLHDFDDHRMEVVRTTGEFHSSGGRSLSRPAYRGCQKPDLWLSFFKDLEPSAPSAPNTGRKLSGRPGWFARPCLAQGKERATTNNLPIYYTDK